VTWEFHPVYNTWCLILIKVQQIAWQLSVYMATNNLQQNFKMGSQAHELRVNYAWLWYTYELNATHIPRVCNCHKYSYFITVTNSLCGHSKGAKLHFYLTSLSLCLGCNNFKIHWGDLHKICWHFHFRYKLNFSRYFIWRLVYEGCCFQSATVNMDGAGYSKMLVNFEYITISQCGK